MLLQSSIVNEYFLYVFFLYNNKLCIGMQKKQIVMDSSSSGRYTTQIKNNCICFLKCAFLFSCVACKKKKRKRKGFASLPCLVHGLLTGVQETGSRLCRALILETSYVRTFPYRMLHQIKTLIVFGKA